MTARAHCYGHEIVWKNGHWLYKDDGTALTRRACGRCSREQVKLPLGGRVVNIDTCIHPLIAALNAGGVLTKACCCGHGFHPGVIILEDGRELFIAPDYKTARAIDAAFPDIWGVKKKKRRKK